ncbi:MAG: metal-sensitive transcriptional regulator [Alphaproteobacteria bacterium]|jgi:DNA-binding FrmR family transcriptional regulator
MAHHPKYAAFAKRIHGQVGGVVRMIEEGQYCPDILMQLKAARASLRTLEGRLLQQHLEGCVQDAFSSGNKAEIDKKIQELVSLMKRYDDDGPLAGERQNL